jgi:3-oxoacyl-[acyl-carrier protein] reductase
MTSLTGRIALVTGGNRGIGAACSLALAQAGCDVAINFRTRTAEAQEIKDQVRALGRRAITVQADVSQSAAVASMVQAIERDLGEVSILVNNAGIARRQKLEDITEADWDEILDVNLKSAFLVTQAVLPKMREQHWGRIINISSVAAQLGGVVGAHYASSKAGMHGLTHSYAGLLAKEGITANAVSPALIDTEMVRANALARPHLIPVERFGTADEIASVVVMLAENAYITGQTINVNGGWYMS